MAYAASMKQWFLFNLRRAVGTQELLERTRQPTSGALAPTAGVAASSQSGTAQAGVLPTDLRAITESVMQQVRSEYTVMPRFQYHQPLDYNISTYPISFDSPVMVPGVDLPVPAPADRMGYAPNDADASSIMT